MIRFHDDRPLPEEDPANTRKPGPSEASQRMEWLVDEITTAEAYVTAASYQLLVWIREFDELFESCGFGAGFRSSAEWLAWRTGRSLTAARERVRVARALADLPDTSAAMARGQLSYSKVRAICRAAPLDRETEGKILHFARHGTATHLERLVRSWRRMGPAAEGVEEKARHDRRYLQLTPEEDGSWAIRGRLDPEVGALVKRALEMGVEALYRRDRLRDVMEEERTGRTVPPDPAGQEWVDPGRRRADALGLVAEVALHVGPGEGAGQEGPEHREDREGQESPEDREDPEGEEGTADGDGAACDGSSRPGDSGDDSAESGNGASSPAGASRASAPEAASGISALDLLPDTRSERYQVVVHVDLATLRGEGEEGDGEGVEGRSGRFAFLDDELRVSAETARRLCCGGSRMIMLNDSEGNVLDVGRRTRAVPTALARAIRFRDRGRCRFPGCTAPGRDHHHAVHWARGGETKLENLLLMCWFHHRAVHEGGFGVEATGSGDFRFRDPSGTVLRSAPALPPVVDDPFVWVEERVKGWLEEEADRRLEEEGPIGPWTITPDWDGLSPDLDLILHQLPLWGSGGGGECGGSETDDPGPARDSAES